MGILAGKIAIITGASSGIGRASALLFAREGARLVVNARGEDQLDQLVVDLRAEGGQAIAVAGDAADEQVVLRMVAAAQDHFGGLDIGFNNAGTLGEMGPTTGVSTQGWRDTLETNLTSAFLAAKHQIPAMLERGSGSLVFTSSFVGHTVGIPGAAAYAASKAGVNGLVQALAAEFGPRGVRVNALLPGGTDTSMAREMNSTPEAMAQVAALHALKRIGAPEEIAQAALFLASDASSFVTGSAMRADGGVSINRS